MSQRRITSSVSPELPTDLIPGTHPASAPAARRGAPVNVLVFDSDPLACASLGSWLNRRGHTVALACTHDMAITLLQRIRFDVAICDESAPWPDSKHWLEKLMRRPPCPLVLISAAPTLDGAIRLANLPVAGYLHKPVDRSELSVLLDRLLPKPGL